MADKVYLKGSAKARETKFGQVLNLSIKATDLIDFAREHANARGYVNLTITQRKTPGQYGDTHSVALDDWEPIPRREEKW